MVNITNDDISRVLNAAYFFLKFRPRSKREVVDYLSKKSQKFKWPDGVVDVVIKELEEEGLVDDRKFVEWFVDQRNRNKPKSEFVLRGELMRFGIDKGLIDDYFSSVEVDEEMLIRQLLQQKRHRWVTLSSKERFQKAAHFLLRRGFGMGEIKKAIDEYEKKW